jgi:serine protease SohB
MTPFKPTTDESREKVQSEISEILNMFKSFITRHRPALNVEKVATGEVSEGWSDSIVCAFI